MGSVQLTVLSRSEIEDLHETTLRVLEETGILVGNEKLRRALGDAGARIRSETAHLPRRMVEELLLQAPRVVRLSTMNGDILQVGGRNRFYSAITMDPYIIDYETGPRRPVVEDVRRLAILADAMPRVSVTSLMEYPPADVPGEPGYLAALEAYAYNTRKHMTCLPTSVEKMEQRIALAQVMSNGLDLRAHSPISLAATTTSPLSMTDVNCRILMAAVDRGIPLIPVICPMAGTTSPYTIAGSLVTGNAEALFCIVAAQALRPGHPVLYGQDPSVTDMQSGAVRYYSHDKFLFRLAAAQLGTFYGIPTKGGIVGTMVGRYDVQNGLENGLFALAAVAGRTNLNGALGSNFNANGTSAEQAVIGDALAGIVERLCGGIAVDERRSAAASIAACGPSGHFMADDLTLEFLHDGEFLDPGIMDYSGSEDPEGALLERAHVRAEDLISNHTPIIPASVRGELDRFFAAERKRL